MSEYETALSLQASGDGYFRPPTDREPQRSPSTGAARVTRTLVVDDHPLFRRGVADLLQTHRDFDLTGEAGTGEDGLRLARSLHPDLVLLDLNLRDMPGVQVLRALRESGLRSRVTVLTASMDPGDLRSAFQAGADGYLLKNADPRAFIGQLRRVASGQLVLDEALAESLVHAIREDRPCEAIERAGLTRREREILQRIASGLGNRQIATDLGLTEGTVKVHVKNLLRKLNLHSRVEAALWCHRHSPKATASVGASRGNGSPPGFESVEPAQRAMAEHQRGEDR